MSKVFITSLLLIPCELYLRGIANELTLVKIKEKGLKKVLITCDDKNVASYKIIEKNGGQLENKVADEGRITRRYWIDL